MIVWPPARASSPVAVGDLGARATVASGAAADAASCCPTTSVGFGAVLVGRGHVWSRLLDAMKRAIRVMIKTSATR